MPWKEQTVEMERERFVKQVLSHQKSMSALCREYGISRKAGYKWLNRYKNGESLQDRDKTPLRNANKTPGETERIILDYRQSHPAIGAVKIKRILENQGHVNLPCVTTVNDILKRNGMITKEASQAATPYKRFEKENPNDMWQADFKGHFGMKDGNRCHPLNIIDDHSRYNLCSDALLVEKFAEVQSVVLRLFETYGIPKSFLCDNGNPWSSRVAGFTKFEVWLMDLGVLTLHGRSWHPQTQGKEESFNRSMKREFLKFTEIKDVADAQRQFDKYREFYNHERPHHALGLEVPASRYYESERKISVKVEDWEYGIGYETRKVGGGGYFSYGGYEYFLSEGFRGKTIGIRESHIPGCISLFYRQFRISRINVDEHVFTFKRAYLIEGDPRLTPPD